MQFTKEYSSKNNRRKRLLTKVNSLFQGVESSVINYELSTLTIIY
ncbi:hypothetical protein BBU29805_Z08 (plasmid) [Borreliella burgdorferi 29805]|uniref:Uncharacterized protein n=1 Tax=Borreliella burgdorferi 118a TaxID=476210 RepID=A0A7U3YB61_BORBG|nr:hypothetical protein BBUWI9123_Z0008 [Borreliella burgdorferi WI91-23]ACN92786.1 hypothetical protein BBU118A_Z08 [Borreliella burgdorferi 118a]ACO38484.1 hypothetical protein BBU29805_Z08 [Borreliella burgdorferi 29805]